MSGVRGQIRASENHRQSGTRAGAGDHNRDADPISHAHARTLAALWQDPEHPDFAVSVLARTGAIRGGTERQLRRDLGALSRAAQLSSDPGTTICEAQTQALLTYVRVHGRRGPVTGWAELPDDGEFLQATQAFARARRPHLSDTPAALPLPRAAPPAMDVIHPMPAQDTAPASWRRDAPQGQRRPDMPASLTIIGPLRLSPAIVGMMARDAADAREAILDRVEHAEKVFHLVDEPDLRGWLGGALPRIGVDAEDLWEFYETSGPDIDETHLAVAEWIMQAPRKGLDTAVVFSGRLALCVPPATSALTLALAARMPVAMLPHGLTLPRGDA